MSTKNINPDEPRESSTEAAEPEATTLPEEVLSEEELRDLAGGVTVSFPFIVNMNSTIF